MNHRTWMVVTSLVLCVGNSASQSAPRVQPSSVAFCELLAFPQKYDKEVVATKALVVSNDHEILVHDPRCVSTVINVRSASIELPDESSTKLAKKLSKILHHDRTAMVAFEAIFYGSGGPYGMEGTRFHFVIRRIVSVEEAQRTEN